MCALAAAVFDGEGIVELCETDGNRGWEGNSCQCKLAWTKVPRLPPSQAYGTMDGGLVDDVEWR